MAQAVLMIGYAWILTAVWQWLALPWLIPYFRQHTLTAGWAFGRVASWLVVSLIIWFLAHFGLGVNTGGMIWVLTLILGAVSWRRWQQESGSIQEWLRSHVRVIVCQEVLFLVGFFGLALIRTFQPNILDLEKFMDAGLMVSYRLSPTLPLEDFWLAGKTFNYYTFGHFMGAVASQFWSIDIQFAYNLLLGLICGLVLMHSGAVVMDLVAKTAIDPASPGAGTALKAGVIGALVVGIGGNGHSLWYWLKQRSFEGYWYPDATRFIDRTIHEFPSYSFIVSDLHAHVWGIPLVLGLVWLVWLWAKTWPTVVTESTDWFEWWSTPVRAIIIGIGVLLGTLIMTSTWDFAIYGLLVALVGLGIWLQDWRRFWQLVTVAVVMLGLAFVTSSPWWLHFESISEGVRWASEHSPLWQLAVLWLPHLTLSLVAMWLAVIQLHKLGDQTQAQTKTVARAHASEQLALWWIGAAVITAICLLILPEMIYVKDIYPNHPRANTMFKLTFQAFILMGIVIGWLIGQFLTWSASFRTRTATNQTIVLHWVSGALLVAFLVGVGWYPYFGFRDYYDRFKNFSGLDGLKWLRESSPDDYKGLQWLKQVAVGRPVVLEAVGESYTTFGRVSTFTGLPTVLGWRVHEWLWRGGFDIPGERTEQVRKMYEEATSPEAKTLFAQYQVKYIFLGDREREAYANLDVVGLKTLGPVVFSSNQTQIIELR